MYIFDNIILLVLDASPYLLMGFVIAGLIKALISEEFIQKLLGKNDVQTVALASLIGAPVPLCSCGVIPVVQGIKKQGASKGATIAFLVSTPETGVDSVAMTYGMMGPVMAILRPIYAILTAFFAGVVELLLFKDEDIKEQTSSCCSKKIEEPEISEPKLVEKKSCCPSSKNLEESNTNKDVPDKAIEVEATSDSCCPSKKKVVEEKPSCCASKKSGVNKVTFVSKIMDGLKYSFTNLLSDISPTLLFGFVLGGIITSLLSEDLVKHYFNGGVSGYIAIVLLSVPMYICATSSTPIAAAFMMKGMSPGTALVFLMAGPATNFTSLSILSKIFGFKSIVSYLSVIIVSSIVFGLLTDYLILIKLFEITLSSNLTHHHEMKTSWLQIVASIVFMAPVFYYSSKALIVKIKARY
ncbi:MAG: SO_0444 family Cu/Zn efflux transporter [Candidatus Cloacimonetes bacterium]|nr:SO_0444 family Cu/Zn efflux transporter [Candidatus Cloacimonadota bacterium]